MAFSGVKTCLHLNIIAAFSDILEICSMQLRIIYGSQKPGISRTPSLIGFRENSTASFVSSISLLQFCSHLKETCSHLQQYCLCLEQNCSRLEQNCSCLEQNCSRLEQNCSRHEQNCSRHERNCLRHERNCSRHERNCSRLEQNCSRLEQTCLRCEQNCKSQVKEDRKESIMLIFNQLKEITNPMNRNKIHRTGGNYYLFLNN